MPGDDTLEQNETLIGLQEALMRVPGVERARVIGTDTPTEIHVVAAGRKPSRQFVRDIESLAAAEFDIDIDHRIVSIVQVEKAPTKPQIGRPSIERVGLGRRNNAEWVEVTLAWPSGESTSGTGAAGTSREARARGAAAAVIECLDTRLRDMRSTLEIDHITLHSMTSSTEWVLIHTTFYEEAGPTPLLGSAQVVDDIATASVRAMLNAVSRKLLRA